MSSSTAGRTDSFRPVVGATVLLFLAVLAVAGVRSWRDLEAARQRKQLLETRITETETQIVRLRNRIERLRSDPGALERLAREDLGMVRPGDVVIELPTASPPGPLSHRPPTDRERGNAGGAVPQTAPPVVPPASVQPAPLPAPPQATTPQPVMPAGGPPASSAPAS